MSTASSARAADLRAGDPKSSAPASASAKKAGAVASWVDEHPDFERLAPVPFSVVCFRSRPRGRGWTEDELDPIRELRVEEVTPSGSMLGATLLLRSGETFVVDFGEIDGLRRC